MKRFSCVCLALALVAALGISPAVAAASELEEADVKTAAEEYLSSQMRKIYLYEDSGLSSEPQTLLEVAQAPHLAAANGQISEDAAVLSVASQQALASFAEDNEPELMASMERQEVSLNDMMRDLQCMEDMTAYKSHVYETQGFAYSYFDAQYHFGDVVIDGDYATAVVYEELNYQYDDCDEPSFELGEYNEGSGDSETEQQQPQDDDVQSEDSTDTPGKIVLDGTPVRWDEFPMPTAETFGLTGEDAIIYNAIAQVYNPKVYADTFSQSPEDVTDLSLPAFEIYEKSKSENGNTIYYGVFYECDYYNLGSDLADLNNPVYSLVKGKSPANLTIDAQGNFVDFEQTPESSNDPYGDIRRVCGPMTELADFLCGETETYSKEPLKVPDLNAEAMVIQYLNYYFCQS